MNKTELCWEIMSRLSDLAEIILEGYFFSRFMRPFVKRKCAACAAGIVYFFGMLFLWLLPFEIRYADFWGTAMAFGALYFFDRRNAAQKIFLSVTMCLLIWLEYGFALVPYNLCFEFILSKPYMQKREWLLFFCHATVQVLHCILQGFLLHWMVGLIHRVYHGKSENVTGKELVLLFSSLFTVIAGRLILSFSSRVYLADTGNYIWSFHGGFHWVKALYQVFSFLAVFLTVAVYQKIRESQQKEKENAVLMEQAEGLSAHIREVEALYGKLRGLRHDMGNHVAVMEGLFLENEPEKLGEYFKRLKEEFLQAEDIAGGGIGSGNPVTDIVLSQKKHRAKAQGIDFSCDFHYPQENYPKENYLQENCSQETNLDAFDVSVILSNLLDNALEAAGGSMYSCVQEEAGGGNCGMKSGGINCRFFDVGMGIGTKTEKRAANCLHPYVQVRSWRRKNIFMIEVENIFSGNLVLDEESGLPQSTKQDGKNHGFGLVNVRRVAQKYFGDVEIGKEGDCVRAVVMLTLKGQWMDEGNAGS